MREIGYDTHGRQQPATYDNERFPCHYDIEPDKECFGELIEHVERKQGYPQRIYYICSDCEEEIGGSVVLNHDRDTNDWEFDMRYDGDY